MGGRIWTQAELDYLEDAWGRVSLPRIAMKLGRPAGGVRCMAWKRKLGPFLECGDYVTVSQLLVCFGYALGSTTVVYKWEKERGFPVYFRTVKKRKNRVVKIDEFWEWAEKNREVLDFSKLEPLSLGEEPAWVQAQRKKDLNKIKARTWTRWDDEMLKDLVAKELSYTEISERMRRSCLGVAKRCYTLGIRYPQKQPQKDWTLSEYRTVEEWILAGVGYREISARIGRTENALRTMLLRRYGTSAAGKLREML